MAQTPIMATAIINAHDDPTASDVLCENLRKSSFMEVSFRQTSKGLLRLLCVFKARACLIHAVTNIATLASAMMRAVAQPSHLSSGELMRLPITFLLLVRSTTNTIKGGASTPFKTADQKSIFTALNPAKLSARP